MVEEIGRGKFVVEGDLSEFDQSMREVEAEAMRLAKRLGIDLNQKIEEVGKKSVGAMSSLRKFGRIAAGVMTGFGALYAINRAIATMHSFAGATERGEKALKESSKAWKEFRAAIGSGLGLDIAAELETKLARGLGWAMRGGPMGTRVRPFEPKYTALPWAAIDPEEVARRRAADSARVNKASGMLALGALGAGAKGAMGEVARVFTDDIVNPIKDALTVTFKGAKLDRLTVGRLANLDVLARHPIADVEKRLAALRAQKEFTPQKFRTEDFWSAMATATRGGMDEATKKQIKKLEEQLSILKQIRDKVDPRARFEAVGIQ